MLHLRTTTIRLCLLILVSGINLFAQRAREIYNGREVAGNEVVIRLKDPSSGLVNVLSSMLPTDSVQILNQELGLILVHSPTRPVAALIDLFANRGDLFYVEPNFTVQAVATPNDPYLGQLWGLQKVGATAAWDITQGNKSTVVGIVDTGVSYNHPDLAANMWSAPAAFTVKVGSLSITCPAGSHGLNAILMTCDPADDYGHGTHVAGTIGAVGNNGVGVPGMNWGTSMMALRFMDASGSGAVSNAIRAINFAIQVKKYFAGTATPVNIRVLSNSWGGSGFSQALLDAINNAGANEMLFVAAAGNAATNDDTAKTYPASYAAATQINVAATDSSDVMASFSSYGPATVQLGAPGVGIVSTYLGDGYASMSGTSMATPHVAGAAALILSGCPDLSTKALMDILLKNVDVVPSLVGKTTTGGRLNVSKSLQACNASRQPSVSSVVVSPSSIQSGQVGSITVGLTAAAGSGGMVVTLSSSDPASAANVPATITIPQGQSSGTVSFTAGTVTSSTAFTITATAYSISKSASGTVTPKTVNVSINTSPLNQGLVIDGVTYSSAQTFQWTSGSSHSIGALAQSASGGVQFVWTGWSDGGAQVHTVAPSADANLVASFKTQYLLTTAVTPAGLGSITASPASATGYYDAGTSVQLSAIPNGGATLLNWTGDLLGSIVSQSIAMTGPRSLTAVFLPAPVIVTPPPVVVTPPPAVVVTPPPAVVTPPPVVVTPPADVVTPTPASGFVTAYALSGQTLRNDYTGWVGMKLTVGNAALVVSSLGRLCVTGNSASHVVKFTNAQTGTDIAGASATVNMASCTPGQFQFTALASSVTLAAGSSYYLVTQEVQGGDKWYDIGQIATTTDATVESSIYAYSAGLSAWATASGAGSSYGPPSFQYKVGATQSGSPFVTSFNANETLRNDYSGWVGMKLTVGASPITVSSLARMCVAGNTGSHTVKFVSGNLLGSDVTNGSAQINMSGCTPGQFTYVALSTPITLQAKTSYLLVSQEVYGGDRWYDFGSVSTSSAATVNSAVYSLLNLWLPVGSGSISYGPLNFK